jgi:hypothetical protein
MNVPRFNISKLVGRQLAIFLFVAISAAGAFATLGDGGKKNSSSTPKALLSGRTFTPGYFSLKSGYDYRGNSVITSDKRYFTLNTVVTLQKGKTTFVLPLKKKVLLSNVKIDLGNRQLRRN